MNTSSKFTHYSSSIGIFFPFFIAMNIVNIPIPTSFRISLEYFFRVFWDIALEMKLHGQKSDNIYSTH